MEAPHGAGLQLGDEPVAPRVGERVVHQCRIGQSDARLLAMASLRCKRVDTGCFCFETRLAGPDQDSSSPERGGIGAFGLPTPGQPGKPIVPTGPEPDFLRFPGRRSRESPIMKERAHSPAVELRDHDFPAAPRAGGRWCRNEHNPGTN
jgi:hypothetical protein